VRGRDGWLPLVDAREALGLPPAPPGSNPKLLMVRAGGGPLALRVDAIEGSRELVVKPLAPLLSGHPLVSGTSLTVTGEVIFALNPAGLARRLRPEGGRRREGSGPRTGSPPAPILVVDDSISVRKAIVGRLRALGHEVEEASDGLEALGRLRDRDRAYALVLSDLEMPRMDGFELLAELNRMPTRAGVPAVVASTRCDPETRRRAAGLGARAFFPKPIEPDALAAMVRELIGSAGATTTN
jgi:CheY-like chemotaxis protein